MKKLINKLSAESWICDNARLLLNTNTGQMISYLLCFPGTFEEILLGLGFSCSEMDR